MNHGQPQALPPRKAQHTANAVFCKEMTELEAIHTQDVNICILPRDVGHLNREITGILALGLEVKTNGTVMEILSQLQVDDGFKENYPLMFNDIKQLLRGFETVSKALFFRFNLSIIRTDMCRKFHTDMNDLRMLCTYAGPGTIWLADDAVNRKELLNIYADHPKTVHPDLEQHANVGDVLLLKGAVYPADGTKALIHRSPSIETAGEQRLLLRIDTNEFLSFS